MPRRFLTAAAFFVSISIACLPCLAGNASTASGEPVIEEPTLQSLGCYWIIKGDDNKNARVEMDYRKVGTQPWKKAMPLFRVDKQADQKQYTGRGGRTWPVSVAADSWMFAGSIVMLPPDTEFEIRLKLVDPDGGTAEKTLRSRTIAEPTISKNAPTYHVMPGRGGGDGSAANPFKGLDAAAKRARPGDVLLVHKGVYEPLYLTISGQSGKPVVFYGFGDGEAVIEGNGSGKGIDAPNVQHVWFERLTIRKVSTGIWAPETSHVVVRRCRIQAEYGIKFNVNDSGNVKGWFVSDNMIEGPCTWPRRHGIENPRGMEMSGQGHTVCYNRVRGFADAIDVYGSKINAAIDIHNNEVSELTDDGIEMDYSDRNTRCFNNRITNAFQGISIQPIFGGPVYVFRNALYNIGLEPFKMHNNPSGGLFIHNTVVKNEHPLILSTSETARNCYYRNNLFVGRKAHRAYHCDGPLVDCDMDYDGFAGGPFQDFMKIHKSVYRTLLDAKAKSPIYKHAIVIEGDALFASGVRPPENADKQFDPKVNDLRLKGGTPAIDAGEPLPNFSDGFAGKGPDLGAFEQGAELPHYGPRPEKK